MTPEEKAELVREARELMRDVWGEPRPGFGVCPLISLALMAVAGRAGIRLVLQAGDLRWRWQRPENDDGVSPTHFGYIWSPEDPASRAAALRGALPEVHVWLGDPVRQEIVDASTDGLVESARRLIGVEWEVERPPDFLWAPARELPADAVYDCSREATLSVARLLERGACRELAAHLRKTRRST